MASPPMLWRFEVNDPLRSTEWRPLWEFTDDDLLASQELMVELNQINAPIQMRVVRLPKSASDIITSVGFLRLLRARGQ